VSPAPNAATRRFVLVWSASLLWKLGALAVFLFVVLSLTGGRA
jgi:hypothetical protein